MRFELLINGHPGLTRKSVGLKPVT